MRPVTQEEILKAAQRFAIEKKIAEAIPYGGGHINDTFRVQYEDGSYMMLQRVNTEVFTKPDELMDNVIRVTAFLADKIAKRGGDPSRETLHFEKTWDGAYYFEGPEGGAWRLCNYVDNTDSFDQVEKPEQFFAAGEALGDFQGLLADYPADTLYESIPDFHNTAKRYVTFLEAVDEDRVGRKESVREMIELAKEYSWIADITERDAALPIRVAHNDSKLNNVLIDKKTGKGICVIDLDTVMPGVSLHDFGEAIRTGANLAAEDEPDTSKVCMDLNLIEVFAKGFIGKCGKFLTRQEIEYFPDSVVQMAYENAIRMLGDHLNGDVYYKIHRENHNRDRAGCQFAIVTDMLKKMPQVREIVAKILDEQ